jgi:hypothetical protein
MLRPSAGRKSNKGNSTLLATRSRRQSIPKPSVAIPAFRSRGKSIPPGSSEILGHNGPVERHQGAKQPVRSRKISQKPVAALHTAGLNLEEMKPMFR